MFPRWCSHGFCAIHGVVRPVALPRPLAAGAQPFRGDGAQCRVAAHAGLGWKVLSVGVPLDGGGGDGDPGATSSRSLLANIVGLAGSGDAAAGLRELLQSRRTSVEVPWASRLLAPARGLLFLTAFPCQHAIRGVAGVSPRRPGGPFLASVPGLGSRDRGCAGVGVAGSPRQVRVCVCARAVSGIPGAPARSPPVITVGRHCRGFPEVFPRWFSHGFCA